MALTIAMTAAPAPASAHTNRWKVRSSCNTQFLFEFLVFLQVQICISFTFFSSRTSLESHILANFSEDVHNVFSSEMATAPVRSKHKTHMESCLWCENRVLEFTASLEFCSEVVHHNNNNNNHAPSGCPLITSLLSWKVNE